MRLFARKSTSTGLAMVLALATGVAATVAVEAPAMAQDEKADKQAKGEAKPEFSPEFVKAYNAASAPLKDKANADYAAAKAQFPAVKAAAKSKDELFQAGSLAYQIANKTDDKALKYDALTMMAESGKGGVDTQGQINYALFETAQAQGNMDVARAALQRAIDMNYSFDATFSDGSKGKIGPDEMRLSVMRTYADADQPQQGVDYIVQQAEKASANGKPSETLLRGGYVAAFQNELGPQATKLGEMWVANYPSPTSWGDVMATQRTYFSPTEPAVLDALRLLARTDALRTERDYTDYINAADARRLPTEVSRIIASGIDGGQLKASDQFIQDAKTEANSRSKGEKSDLAELAKDARASGADAGLITSAANSHLSTGEAATAEELYALALTKPSVDQAQALTRMGIAQVEQGKYAEAQATFAKVQGDGARKNIADLWAIYAQQQASGTPAATTPTDSTAAPATAG